MEQDHQAEAGAFSYSEIHEQWARHSRRANGCRMLTPDLEPLALEMASADRGSELAGN